MADNLTVDKLVRLRELGNALATSSGKDTLEILEICGDIFELALDIESEMAFMPDGVRHDPTLTAGFVLHRLAAEAQNTKGDA